MKYTKHDIDNLGGVYYRRFICNFGLKAALRVAKKILRLLNAEKKRRKSVTK